MTKSKETLAKLAADYYFWIYQQVPLRQDNLFKTYLWLASLVLSLAVFLLKEMPPQPLTPAALPLYLSMAVAALVIVFCLANMRGLADIGFPNLKTYAEKMQPDTEDQYLTYLTEDYWELTRPGKALMGRRARSLRATTWALTLCFLTLALAGILAINSVPPNKEVMPHGGRTTNPATPATTPSATSTGS